MKIYVYMCKVDETNLIYSAKKNDYYKVVLSTNRAAYLDIHTQNNGFLLFY